uniref:Interferon regulatory factor n=1 Tax=Cyprinus carpio TaxID=7962 RepID=A0A0M4FIN4_CYPCA|nr:interferon regulatory factor-1 [Cyprinus carpio]
MPVSRMRMRPWLENRIDSNTIAGLTWVNKEEKMFSIPWKHAARHGWQVEKDASLFKQWAIHTGKYTEGVTTPDPKTWKANFRCAMNSLPDIEEVKDKSINKGCSAVRVYRMLPAIAKKKMKRSRSRDSRKRKIKTEEADTHEMHSEMTQENTIDSTVNLSTANPSEIAPAYEVELGNCPEDPYKFQVSPVHSTDLEENEAIIEVSRQLERDSTQWLQSNFFTKGFLANEVATTESLSPESQWSESSGEELEFRLYTELTPDLHDDSPCTYTELMNSSSMPQTMCPL